MIIRVSRRALVAMPIVLATIAVAGYLTVSSGPSDTRTVNLPPTFMGLNTSPHNDASLPQSISESLGGAPTALTSYGEPGTTMLNVVATRTDMTGKVDLHLLGDSGRSIGGTRCTRNVVLRGADEDVDTPGTPLSGKVLCWRTSEQLSISAFVLSRPPAEEDVAAAVDALWLTLD